MEKTKKQGDKKAKSPSILGKNVMVIINDGRRFYGILEAVDCLRNIVLKNSVEEVLEENCSTINRNIHMHIRKIFKEEEDNPYLNLEHLGQDKKVEFNKKFQENIFYHNGLVIPGKEIRSICVQKINTETRKQK